MSKSRNVSPSEAHEPTVRRDLKELASQSKPARAPDTGRLPEDTEAPLDAPQGAWDATVARDVLVGKQLGDYVVKRRIGDGGMGIVYEGEHPVIGRKVAIKVLRPELTEGAQARDLIAEARAASAIRHRGIIDVFGFGTIPGLGQYLVMEFLQGTPLNEVIAKRAPMAETEVITLLDELLSALAAAHAVGVIHRDLKPGNIFVERDSSGAESVKVLDFGLAKRSAVPNGTTPQTRASMIVGTPEYMAPEQATGQAVGPFTDLYAVGLIAFEMLTRRLPFEGASAMAYVIHHVQTAPPAPSSFVPVHPDLDALVLRLLEKDPAQRPASAEEARQELKRLLPQLSQPEALSISPSAPRVSGSGRRSSTVVRPTPARPTTRPPRSAPGLSAAPAPEPSPPVSASVPVASAPARRLGLMLAVVGVAVALGGVMGWMLRRDAPAPSAVGQAPLANAPSLPSPAPPAVPPAPVMPAPAATVGATAAAPAPAQALPPTGAASPQAPVPAVPPVNQEGALDASPPSGTPGDEAKAKRGTLRLVVRGTGEIWVDGRKRGEVPPLNTLELPAGRHKLEILNPRAQPYAAFITITAGKTLRHSVTLRPARSSAEKK